MNTKLITDIKNFVSNLPQSNTYKKTDLTEVKLSSKNTEVHTYIIESEYKQGYGKLTNGLFYKTEISNDKSIDIKYLTKLKELSKKIFQKLGIEYDYSDKVVIARDKDMLGIDKDTNEPIYNEWVIGLDTYTKTYGDPFELSTKTYTKKLKLEEIKGIEITPEIFEILKTTYGLKENNGFLQLPVDFGNRVMEFEIGDFLTNKGYSIDKEAMEGSYEMVNKGSCEVTKTIVFLDNRI